MHTLNTIAVALSASALFMNTALAVPSHNLEQRHPHPQAVASSAAITNPSAAASAFWAEGSGDTSEVARAAAPTDSSTPSTSTAAAPSAAAAPAGSSAASAPGPLTAQQLIQIDSTTASCSGAQNASQCRTAEQAAGPIQASFDKYGITHPSVKATLIATMLYESASFRYYEHKDRNGQGTRNMMSKQFVQQYATSLGLQPAEAFVNDTASFGSAAWFITTHCPLSTRQHIWGGNQSGYEDFVTNCLGAPAGETQRTTLWQAGIKVLGSA